jgi:hypothetical protein
LTAQRSNISQKASIHFASMRSASMLLTPPSFVMPGLVPGIHVFAA